MIKMRKINRFVYWLPRILAILFLLYLAMFSLDIFDANYDFWGTVLGLFMHNIPVLVLLIVLIIAWKYELVGGIVFILAGLLYIIMTIHRVVWYIALSWSLTIAGPAFIIGILFFLNWYLKRKRG
ncbi:MAG: hypothetical protein NTW67_04915 [Candidatus Woesearchaeota archaeon]|nr:hypothetical protein [Candidatus Woesearchaeota archaeon]